MAEALVVCRFLQFAAAMFLVGTSTFLWWLVPGPLQQEAERPLWRLSVVAILVAAVTAVAWLLLETGQVAGDWADTVDPDTLSGVLFDTAFGQAWIWRLLLAILLLACLAVPRRRRWQALALASGVFLASLGLVGHAAIDGGALGVGHRLNHAVHLLAAAMWVGALMPLWVCLRLGRKPVHEADLATVLRRFSSTGHLAVALVLLSGVVDTYLVLGHLPLDFSSPYQALLALKIALVGTMVLIALVNRYAVVPRMGRGESSGLRGLVRGTVAELVLGGFVVALVSAFATFDPK